MDELIQSRIGIRSLSSLLLALQLPKDLQLNLLMNSSYPIQYSTTLGPMTLETRDIHLLLNWLAHYQSIGIAGAAAFALLVMMQCLIDCSEQVELRWVVVVADWFWLFAVVWWLHGVLRYVGFGSCWLLPGWAWSDLLEAGVVVDASVVSAAAALATIIMVQLRFDNGPSERIDG